MDPGRYIATLKRMTPLSLLTRLRLLNNRIKLDNSATDGKASRTISIFAMNRRPVYSVRDMA